MEIRDYLEALILGYGFIISDMGPPRPDPGTNGTKSSGYKPGSGERTSGGICRGPRLGCILPVVKTRLYPDAPRPGGLMRRRRDFLVR